MKPEGLFMGTSFDEIERKSYRNEQTALSNYTT
jgi:hypothetical protein